MTTTKKDTGNALPGATPAQKPARRYVNFETFCRLDGVTDTLINDMARVLYGDGYGKVGPKTRAFMAKHNLACVSLYGSDYEVAR